MTFRTSVPIAQGQFGPPSGDVAIANVEDTGTSIYVPHADHTHAFPAAVAGAGATASAPGDAEADGNAATAARSDHKHGREANPAWTAAVTATTATAGAATALPATPAGYVETDIGGTTFKLPYYDV